MYFAIQGQSVPKKPGYMITLEISGMNPGEFLSSNFLYHPKA
jgi:hypothetical protein